MLRRRPRSRAQPCPAGDVSLRVGATGTYEIRFIADLIKRSKANKCVVFIISGQVAHCCCCCCCCSVLLSRHRHIGTNKRIERVPGECVQTNKSIGCPPHSIISQGR